MKKIAWIVTDKNNFYKEIEVFSQLLQEKHNIAVELVSWLHQDTKDLSSYDLIILGGCDGYHANFVKFNHWLDSLQSIAHKVFNPIAAIRWNMEKTYLQRLESAGFPTAPSIWVKKHDKIPYDELLKKDWRKVIFKPTISAGSRNTFIFDMDELKKKTPEIDYILNDSGLIIQQFMDQAIAFGEFSFLFFDKKFSHAVLKTPAQGDFRAGIRQGAVVKGLEINNETTKKLLTFAQKLVDFLPYELLYSRIDLLLMEEKIMVMEVEIIEPLLYSEFNKDAASNYVNTIVKRIN